MNTSEALTAQELTVTLPRLAGTRERGAELASGLPDDLSTDTVIIDATSLMSASQGFTDELCKNILEVRNASNVIVVSSPDRFKQHVLLSVKNRDFTARISFRN